MQTVTFAKRYDHKIDELRTAVYTAGLEIEVSNEVAAAAKKAGALKPQTKGAKNGRGSAETNGESGSNSPEG